MQNPTHLLIAYNDRGEPFLQRPLVDAEIDDSGLITGKDPQNGFDCSYAISSVHTLEFRKVASSIDVPMVRTN